MVGDDEVDAEGGCRFGGRKGANAGIDADNQAGSRSDGGFDDLALHAVAFAQPVGNVEADFAAGCVPDHFASHFYGRLQQDDGDGSVDVVVAVDEDGSRLAMAACTLATAAAIPVML